MSKLDHLKLMVRVEREAIRPISASGKRSVKIKYRQLVRGHLKLHNNKTSDINFKIFRKWINKFVLLSWTL